VVGTRLRLRSQRAKAEGHLVDVGAAAGTASSAPLPCWLVVGAVHSFRPHFTRAGLPSLQLGDWGASFPPPVATKRGDGSTAIS
jgi:hypothetical protein